MNERAAMLSPAAAGLAGAAHTEDEVDEVRRLLQAKAGDERARSARESANLQGMRDELGRAMMRDAPIESFRAIRTQLGSG